MSVSAITVDGREFSAKNYVGQSIAFVGKEFRPQIPTKDYGKKDAWKCDVVILDGTNEGYYYEDVLVFQTALISQLDKARKSSDGQDVSVIGTLERRANQAGDNHYFVVAEASTVELRLAAKYGV